MNFLNLDSYVEIIIPACKRHPVYKVTYVVPKNDHALRFDCIDRSKYSVIYCGILVCHTFVQN